MFKLILFPFRLVIGFVKFAGVRGVLFMAIGVGIGLLVAPQRGAQLRAQLQARLASARTDATPPPEAHVPA